MCHAVTTQLRRLRSFCRSFRAVIAGLRETLLDPTMLELVKQGYRERLLESKRRPDDEELAQAVAELTEAEAAVRNITAAFAKEAWSEDLARALREATDRRATLREQVASLTRRADPTRPDDATPAAVETLIARLFKVLATDAKVANDILRKHLGSVVLTPQREGPRGFHASGAFSFGFAENTHCGGPLRSITEEPDHPKHPTKR